MSRGSVFVVVACLIGTQATSVVSADEAQGAAAGNSDAVAVDAASQLARRIDDPLERSLAEEALARNPRLHSLAAQVRVAGRRAEQVGGLPDLQAMVTGYIEPPETRVGPQRMVASVMQPLPWGGKRALSGKAEAYRAQAMQADLAAERLQLVTDVRRIYHELAFVDTQIGINNEFRQHLVRHEEIARARYTTGRGGGQGVLKLQAEITRVDQRKLGLETRRATLGARLNGMLDRVPGTPVPSAVLGAPVPVVTDTSDLAPIALARRPELAAAEARIAVADTRIEKAEKSFRPDFMIGLTYGFVDRRDDPAGRLNPPPDNGQDILGVQGGISIPLWSKQRHAGLDEAAEMRSAGESGRAEVTSSIAAELADLSQRIDLTWREIRLLEDLLIVQAEEALEAAQSGYVAGSLNALELFEAEHLLFDTRTAVARATADYLIAVAGLEGAIGARVPIGAAS